MAKFIIYQQNHIDKIWDRFEINAENSNLAEKAVRAINPDSRGVMLSGTPETEPKHIKFITTFGWKIRN